jgi:hypothetical protein
MKQGKARPQIPMARLAGLSLPFALPLVLAIAWALLIGDGGAGAIVPGSGLKAMGLCATVLTGIVVWCWVVRGMADGRSRKFAALFCGATSLMGWPVWTMGLLPGLNGLAPRHETMVTMTLMRTETTRGKHGSVYHWAWLEAEGGRGADGSGRYFISQSVHDRWAGARPKTVRLVIADGVLGARLVLRFE